MASTLHKKKESRDRLASWIALAARQWRRALDIRLEKYGLTEATWLPLLHLSRAEEPMRQKDLAASLLLDNSSVVRILYGLQVSGLIERTEDAEDRRAKAIVITKRGRDLVARVEEVSSEVRKETLAQLNDHDIAVATKVLQDVCKALAVLNLPKSNTP
jgi:MarR family transcriptional regulator, transcriptional regulator for hemolysin